MIEVSNNKQIKEVNMISNQKERITVSISKSNAAIAERECCKYNKTKSKFIDYLIEKYDNDFFFRNIVVYNVGEKLRENGFRLTKLGNFKFSQDELSVLCFGFYFGNNKEDILRVTLLYDFTIKSMEEI